MEQRILEGTWEEILSYSSELTGQRVKLVVLAEEPQNSSTPETLDKRLKGRLGRVRFQPSDLSERTGKTFAELLGAEHNSSEYNQ